MLLGPEIRYYLHMALDEESKIILTKILHSRNKSVLMRSPEEKTLSRLRRNVLAKVCRAFYRIKKEFYPELTDKFKPPQHVPDVAVDDVEEEEDAPYVEEDDSLPVRQPNFEKNVETPIRAPAAQKSVEAPVRAEEEEEEELVVEEEIRLKSILQPLDEILTDFGGVCAVVSTEYDIISES